MGDDAATVHATLHRMGWPAVLRAIGFKPVSDRVPCPVHNGKGENCALGSKGGRLVFFCHSHQCAGDVLDFLGAFRGEEGFREKLELGASVAGVTINPMNPENHDTENQKRQREREAYLRATEPERTYPPEPEVTALWSACLTTMESDQARTYLEQRGLDPAAVADRDLARAIPDGAPLPRWARCRGQSWSESGHRLLVPFYDAAGRMRTLRATDATRTHDIKRASPAGHTAKGLVMADGTGRAMLEAGSAPPWWPTSERFMVVVVEGEPDLWTWATRFGEAESTPAVLGVIAGAWTDAIAARVPDDALVIVRTHHDPAGDGYAERIRSTLAGRCEVRRSKTP